MPVNTSCSKPRLPCRMLGKNAIVNDKNRKSKIKLGNFVVMLKIHLPTRL